MELWQEMSILQETNLTRDGSWLPLVKAKQERLAKSNTVSQTTLKEEVKNKTKKEPSKRCLIRQEKRAQKARRAERAKRRAARRQIVASADVD